MVSKDLAVLKVSTAGQLTLWHKNHPEFSGFSIDFTKKLVLARLSQSMANDPLRKALGNAIDGAVLWDFTLGQGMDALQFARLGLNVFAWERSEIVFSLWEDARRRGMESEHKGLKKALARIHAFQGDAKACNAALERGEIPRSDFIYLDPMYPESKSGSAKRKKELVLLRELVGDDTDAEALLSSAFLISPARIIVKRPRHGEALFKKPQQSFAGKSHRFDVYKKSLDFP